MGEVKDFPVKCQVCKQVIQEGKIFYIHPKIGYVCEDCPEFNDGPISATEYEVDEE